MPVETDFPDYSENFYGKKARLTSESYRTDLASWQVPAIQKHIGDLTGKVFIDIGAGDIILGEKLSEIGIPKKFYVQDLSKPSLVSGLQRIRNLGVDTNNFHALVSDNFNFDAIEDRELDYAFSNSLFSHLTINSIVLCLQRLRPKMKLEAKYFSSMIILPDNVEKFIYDWSYLNKHGINVKSCSIKDPFHYTENTIKNLQNFRTGFEVKAIHSYGHPFQKLVEFSCL